MFLNLNTYCISALAIYNKAQQVRSLRSLDSRQAARPCARRYVCFGNNRLAVLVGYLNLN